MPRRVDKPWGCEIRWAHTGHYAAKILHVDAGHRLALQYHREEDESCYLLSGKLLLVQGGPDGTMSEATISEGNASRNAAESIHTIHTIEAIEAIEDADVLEVSTPQRDDVVRLVDDWGREGTRAPRARADASA